MSIVVFNKYKSFHVPKTPTEAPRHRTNQVIITNGFEFLRWTDIDDTEDPELALSTGSESPEAEPSSVLSSLSATSDSVIEEEVGEDHGKLGMIPKKIKMSKQERKQLKKDKKQKKMEARKIKKAEEQNEILVAGTNEESPDSHHLFRHSNSNNSSNHGSKQQVKYLSSTINIPTADKLRHLKSLYLNLASTKETRIGDFHDITIFKEDIFNLNHEEWLNDNNLSYMYEYFEKHQLRHFIHSNDILLNSKLALRFKNLILLLKPSIAFLLLKNPDPASLKGILPPLELSSFIFIPINDNDDVELAEGGSHWSLVVISILDGKAFVYDTLSDEEDENNNPEALDLVKNLNIYMKANARGIPDIKAVRVRTPQQINGSDCGVHVLQISAILLSRLIYAQDNIPIDFRLESIRLSALDGRIFILETIANNNLSLNFQ